MRLLISLLGAIFMSSAFASDFNLTSNAFKDGGMIPAKYTCVSDNISPQLSWSGAPEKTQSFALIIADPDAPAGTWYHWVLFNIPNTVSELSENIQELPNGTISGKSSYNNTHYNGPCPPSGQHHYIFNLYALDTKLNLPEGSPREKVEAAMQGHVLQTAILTGLFKK
ncbi:MAG: YbhB/YbcL family Raf kinase inhibitor-like protein [Gammaproteobacteria bacterium]